MGDGARPRAAPGRHLISPELIGRERELGTMLAVLTDQPAVLIVAGEAGVGKTRLATELLARPELAGWLRLSGRCQQIRETFPLGPVIEAIRGVGKELRGLSLGPVTGALRPLLPELAGSLPQALDPLDDRQAERHRLFRGLVDILTALTSVRPVVLLLEDLHWADGQTLDFLAYLLSGARKRLTLVLTYRSEDADADLDALTARTPPEIASVHMSLQPLDASATGALTAAILGIDRVSEEFGRYLWERTGGLPLAVEEVIALIQAQGLLMHGGSGWARRQLEQLEVPRGIRDPTLQRVARLTQPAQRVVEAAAVLQVAVPPAVLLETTGDVDRPVEAVELAVETGLLVADRDTIGFRHVLAAQAVADELSLVRRQQVHARAAAARRRLGTVPLGRVAHHLQHAGRLEEWADAAEQAADQATGLGHADEAFRLLEDVLRHVPLEADRRVRLAVKLGWAAVDTLHAATVVDLLSEVLAAVLEQEVPAALRGELRFVLAQAINFSGADLPGQHRLFTEALAELEDAGLRAWSAAALGIPVAPGVPLADHLTWVREAVRLAAAVTDRSQQAHVLSKAGSVLIEVGDPRWHRVTERVLELTGGSPRQPREVNAHYSLALSACYAGHLRSAGELLATGLSAPVATESPRLNILLRSAGVLLAYFEGRWDGLRDETGVVLDALADYTRNRIDVELVDGFLALATGDLDRAGRRLSGVLALAEDIAAHQTLPLAAGATARLALALGKPADGLAAAGRLVADLDAKGVWAPVGWALPSVAEAMAAAGEPDAARELVDRAEREFARLDVPLAGPAVMHARGLLLGRADDLLAAATGYAVLPAPYEAARATEQAAVRLLENGDVDRAQGALRDAAPTLRRLGATWDYDRVAATGRGAGIRIPPRQRGGVRARYTTVLSPRELEVAELAAAGRTNRQIAGDLFVSEKTVDKHVTAALRKLGLHSRLALARHLDAARNHTDGAISP